MRLTSARLALAARPALAALAAVLSLSSPAGAAPYVAPTPLSMLEDAVVACARDSAGDPCTVRIEGAFHTGVCLPFVRQQLVCAVDAPE